MNLYGLLDAIINKVNRAVKVEKQELDSSLQKQARENINVPSKNEVCNPNLLDNWYFLNPVNQRGQTSYTSGYGIDRWFNHYHDSPVTISDNGLNLKDGPTTDGFIFEQRCELMDDLAGRQVTASLLVADVAGSAVVQCGDGHMVVTTAGLHTFTVDSFDSNRDYLLRMFKNSEDLSITLIAAKVELGDTQTLAHQDSNGNWVLNEIPKYEEELLKCSQYDPYTGEYIGLRKFSQPRNLLDNSNFRNPVNQRGSMNHTGTGYWIDRWYGNYDGASFSIDVNGILILSGNLQQWLSDKHTGKTLTLAACNADGIIEIGSCSVPEATDYRWLCANYSQMFVGIMQADDGRLCASVSKNESSAPIVWAALYEGTYTLETLPEYKPKKYEEELLICRQYDPFTGEYIGLRKFSQPQNLLDNSDFINPVNQRNIANGAIVPSFTNFIDRWGSHSGSEENVYITEQGVDTSAHRIYQRIPSEKTKNLIGKQVTAAVKFYDGTLSVISFVLKEAPGWDQWIESISTEYILFNGVGDSTIYEFIVINMPSPIQWAALYEGIYTTDTLPEYQPKGYAAELVECLRYFERLNVHEGQTSATHFYLCRNFHEKRIIPTFTFTTEQSENISGALNLWGTKKDSFMAVASQSKTNTQTYWYGTVDISADL